MASPASLLGVLFIIVRSASIPAVRQNRSKLTETASQALPTAPIPVGGEAINVVLTFFMALLSFADFTPRAYRLKASNAAPPISTFPGAIPGRDEIAILRMRKEISPIQMTNPPMQPVFTAPAAFFFHIIRTPTAGGRDGQQTGHPDAEKSGRSQGHKHFELDVFSTGLTGE